MCNRMESAAIDGYVDAGIGRRMRESLILHAEGFTKNPIGHDLTKVGLLPIDVTHHTPSLSAIVTHAQRHNQSLAHALYGRSGLGFKP